MNCICSLQKYSGSLKINGDSCDVLDGLKLWRKFSNIARFVFNINYHVLKSVVDRQLVMEGIADCRRLQSFLRNFLELYKHFRYTFLIILTILVNIVLRLSTTLAIFLCFSKYSHLYLHGLIFYYRSSGKVL